MGQPLGFLASIDSQVGIPFTSHHNTLLVLAMFLFGKKDLLTVSIVAIVLGAAHGSACGGEPSSNQQVLQWMRTSRPLQKVHYSWPVRLDDYSDEQWFQYARLTHAISLSGAFADEKQISRATRLCNRVNVLGDENFASLGFVFSPWDRRWKSSTPPSDVASDGAEEVKFLSDRASFLANAVRDANERFSAEVRVTCVMLECERFFTSTDDPEHNLAMDRCYDAAYDIVRAAFKDARIEWYNRGSFHPDATQDGWSPSRHFTGREKGDSFSCSLYRVPEIETTREIFRRTAAHAEEFGCDNVTPWVALASGYKRQANEFQEWSFDWNYDLIYSYLLGGEINNPWFADETRRLRFAPWGRAEVAVFYPEPFGRAPHWGQHFIAYVWGAHARRELPGSVEDEIGSTLSGSPR